MGRNNVNHRNPGCLGKCRWRGLYVKEQWTVGLSHSSIPPAIYPIIFELAKSYLTLRWDLKAQWFPVVSFWKINSSRSKQFQSYQVIQPSRLYFSDCQPLMIIYKRHTILKQFSFKLMIRRTKEFQNLGNIADSSLPLLQSY